MKISVNYQISDKQDRWIPFVFSIPLIVAVIILVIIPLLWGVSVGFTDTKLLGIPPKNLFTFDNYVALFEEGEFWNSVKVTLIYSFFTVLGGVLFGLVTALVLNANFAGRAIVRTLIILPWAVPHVVAALVWQWMYNPDFGIVNYFLTLIPFLEKGPTWLGDPDFAMAAVTVVTVWKTYPFATIMILAGLQSIREDLYEASEIDGAKKLRQFVDITLPGLQQVLGIVCLLLIIWSFGNFVFIFLMTQGGPVGATETLVIRIYLEAFRFMDGSGAFAAGTILLSIALVFTLFYLLFTRQELQ